MTAKRRLRDKMREDLVLRGMSAGTGFALLVQHGRRVSRVQRMFHRTTTSPERWTSVDLQLKSLNIETSPVRGSRRVLATRPTRCPPHRARLGVEGRLVMTGQKIAAGGQSIGR